MKTLQHVVAVGLLTAISLPASAQLFSDDEARRAILDLRAKVAAMEADNQALSGRLDGMARGQLELFSQIERLREDLANLRGTLEQTSQATTVNKQQQKELFQNLEQQLQQADARLRQFEPQPFEVDGQMLTVSPGQKQAFEAIQSAIAAKDFKTASNQLVRFNQSHPTSPLAPWSLFFEGTVHYAQKNFQSAIRALNALQERHPQHPKTADGMLTLSASQVEAGQTTNATKTLQELIKRFPNTEQAKTARSRLASIKPPAKN
jgi:tol-pal system protein YbgF